MFQNREDAARQLAERLKHRKFRDPLVLAIPRGGVPVGAVLADELNAELDVVLSRKLRAPTQPELAVGAISEGREVYLNAYAQEAYGIDKEYLREEKEHQLAEIARRQELFRRVRPRAPITGRSVVLTDDGIATGATMIAALQLLRTHSPHEVLVAVPVASPKRLAEVQRWCDEVVCLLAPADFYAIGQFYEDFRQIEDEEVVTLLRESYAASESHRQLT
jgi:predicted phosphoribosyltransferase